MQNRARRIINIGFWRWSPEPALLFSKIRTWSSSSTNAFVQRALPFDRVPKKLVLQSPRFLCASPPATRNPIQSRTRTSSGAPRNPENKRKDLRSHDQHTHARVTIRAARPGSLPYARRGGVETGARAVQYGGRAQGGCTLEARVFYPPFALTCLGTGLRWEPV